MASASVNINDQNAKYPWEKPFESTFRIKPDNNRNQFRLIIGQAPYKQQVGIIPLRVDINSDCSSFYADFKQVAFLVNKWIKIQDSLEMIFNMLTGDSAHALMILNYLRKNKINTVEFGEYLLKNYNLMMVNSKDHQDQDQINCIKDLIKKVKTQNKTMEVNILVTGKKILTEKIEKCNYCEVIHPSGTNLAKNRTNKYYDTWYNFTDESMKEKFGLPKPSWSTFHVLK